MNCYFNKERRKAKDTWWILAKKLALLVDSSDLQFCIIGFPLYKSALLHSTSLRTWYISKKFHLNVTLKACRAEDHSKCQNSLMRPVTEFRISLCHIFLKWISKTKLCIWNLDFDLHHYPVSLPSKAQTFFSLHGCLLDFYLFAGTYSFTDCREKYTSLAPLSTELNMKRYKKSWTPIALITQKQTQFFPKVFKWSKFIRHLNLT